MSNSYNNLAASPSGSKPPVQDFASLPTSGNTDGDTRVTLDTHALYVWNEGASSWDLLSSGGGGGVISVNGDSGPAVVLTTDDIAEGTSNLYFTVSRAKSAAVSNAIVDGVTDVAPSQNAVFDALAAFPSLSSAIVLNDNTSSPTNFLSYAATNNFAIYEYSIKRNGNYRVGRLLIATDGTTVSISDDFVENGAVGVIIVASVSAGNVVLQYTTSNTGFNASFKSYSKLWS